MFKAVLDNFTRHFRSTIVSGAAMLAAASAASGATPEQIDAAIAKGKKYLYSLQQPEGRWEQLGARIGNDHLTWASGQGDSFGGYTALCVYALVSCGDSITSPKLRPAVEFLQQADMVGTYAIALRSLVWSAIPPTRAVKAAAMRDSNYLLRAYNVNGVNYGLYHYTIKPEGTYDMSASQFGVLGSWGVDQVGANLPYTHWYMIDGAVRAKQQPDGGWRYDDTTPTTIQMTAGGVASLYITQDYLTHSSNGALNGNIFDPNITRGIKYLAANWNTIKPNADPYLWFGIVRVGLASGLKYFGDIDWYQSGADALLAAQAPDGHWEGPWNGVPSTALAMLFLSKGRTPIVVNKLAYSTGGQVGPWNQRPRDVAHFTRWTSVQLEKELTWQIVDLDTPQADTLEAPIVYLAGNKVLNLPPGDEARLKHYVEQGGLIVGNADGSDPAFINSFRKLGKKLFPDYDFRELPADHPIYTNEQFPLTRWKTKPSMQGLSNGVREFMLLLPADGSKTFQTGPDPRLLEPFELMSDIILYATDKSHYRLTPPPADSTTLSRLTVKVARLQYGPGDDPEPGGWPRFSKQLAQQGIEVDVEPVPLSADKLSGFQLAHLTGTAALSLTAAQKTELKRYIDSGGLLLIDAAGGSKAFADSAAALMKDLDAGDALAGPLPANSPLYNATGGVPQDVQLRNGSRDPSNLGAMPKLYGQKAGDRLVVIYSPGDLSYGLLGQYVDGVNGFAPDTAADLMRRIVIYASGQAFEPPRVPRAFLPY